MFICAYALFVAAFAYATDIIITIDEKKIEAKVLEISETEIKYKEADDLEGPTYILGIPKVHSIVLGSGKVKTFNTKQQEAAEPIRQMQQPEPVMIDATSDYLSPAIYAYIDGFPKNVVFVEGDYSMLYDKESVVFFQFSYDNAEIVQYDHNDKHIESHLGSIKEFKNNHASDFEGFDISHFEKLASDKFNSVMRNKKCTMVPYSNQVNTNMPKQFLLNFNVEKMDVGSGVVSAMSVNGGTTSGGVILCGKITIYDLSSKEKVCTLYADRVKGIGSPHFHARIVNTLEDLFGKQLFFIKKVK